MLFVANFLVAMAGFAAVTTVGYMMAGKPMPKSEKVLYAGLFLAGVGAALVI